MTRTGPNPVPFAMYKNSDAKRDLNRTKNSLVVFRPIFRKTIAFWRHLYFQNSLTLKFPRFWTETTSMATDWSSALSLQFKFWNVSNSIFEMWAIQILKCHQFKLWNVTNSNSKMSPIQILKCHQFKFQNVTNSNFEMWAIQILQCHQFKFWNVNHSNFEMSPIQILKCHQFKFWNVTNSNFEMSPIHKL